MTYCPWFGGRPPHVCPCDMFLSLHNGVSVMIHVSWLTVLQEVARRSVTKTQVDVENGEEEEDDAQMVSTDFTETLTRLVFLCFILCPHALGFSLHILALEWPLLPHSKKVQIFANLCVHSQFYSCVFDDTQVLNNNWFWVLNIWICGCTKLVDSQLKVCVRLHTHPFISFRNLPVHKPHFHSQLSINRCRCPF